MKNIKRALTFGLASVIVAGCLMISAVDLHAESEAYKKILLLNSYHAGYKGSDDIVLGFKETVLTSFPNAEVVIEYLDSKHFSGPEFNSRVLDTLTFKYRKQPYDLIVSTDDYAFNTLEPYRDQLFGQTPVVFCGTNNFDKERIKNRPDFIGVDESPSFTETLELMFKLHPETKEVITIHDDSVTGQLNSADFRKGAARFETRATFTYLNGKKLEELLNKVGQLKPGTLVVYFASFVQDSKGKRLSSVEALKMISKASTVPIYGGWEFNLGHGIVGGRLINLREHGKAAAHLAVKVLQGESPSSLATLQQSPNQFMFDYDELKRFAIAESGLPTGSEVINRPLTFFSRYGTILLSLLSASLLLLVVIIFAKLLTSNRNLKQSHIKFSSMVEAFDGLMYVCSSEYRIEFMNERMIQRTGHDATGELCYKALHGLNSVCSWCRNDRVFAGENIHWEVQSPQDSHWYSVSNTLVKNSDGTFSKQAMMTDVTERKKLEEEKLALGQHLQQTQRLESLGVLAGGIAHDFNNILAIIMGYCSLIELDYKKADVHIPKILNAAERAAGLCRQMLVYAGKSQFVQASVSIESQISETVGMLKETLPQHATIKFVSAPDIPLIKADASQISQLAMNFIINASEAIGEAQGEVIVSLSKVEIKAGQLEKDYLGKTIPSGWYVCLECTDTGCGMSDETYNRIFEPFYTTKFTGRGLGMSAALGIITSHQGALQLSSTLGQGTTFKVYLPIKNGEAAGGKSLQSIAPEQWHGSGTVLLVEDEEHLRTIAKNLLEEMGFVIIEASNGKEALEQYQQHASDILLVLTDIGMPVMDGYTLFRKLKNIDSRLPIIISSGFGDAVVTTRIPGEEIAGSINKPYRHEQLRDVLKNVVDGAKRSGG